MAQSPAAILYDATGTELKGQRASAASVPVTVASDQSSLSVQDVRPSTGSQSSVAASLTSVTIKAANANRIGLTVFNDSNAGILYLLLGAGTASSTVFSVALQKGGGYYEVPYGYTGVINGVWSVASGAARVTEFTL